jgi:hypothetical protein
MSGVLVEAKVHICNRSREKEGGWGKSCSFYNQTLPKGITEVIHELPKKYYKKHLLS